ncbi:MAG: ribosome maturation factor RimP [Mycobacteriales bacterium]
MTSRTPTAESTRLAALLGPLVAAAGFDLEQVTVTGVGRRSVVRVIVDADGGVSLDAVAEISRLVSDALDETGYSGSAGAEAYTLEVSSPGIDRPLTEPRHWRRAVGRLVRTTVDGERVEGRVSAADEAGVVLSVDGEARSVPYGSLGHGSVQVEFARKDGGHR